MTWNAAAVARLVAIGLVGGILQLTTVSQVAVFGVPADLSPLLVGAVGLLCGSIAGACFGFGLGLFMDTLLAQTLGAHVARAARRRLRRRPAARAARPGARARAGRGRRRRHRGRRDRLHVLQFLLGVDAPVSLLLVRQILLVIVLNTLLAMPVYLVCRRVLGPFLPDDPRRRRRRAYTTGGLSPLSRA